MVQGQARSVPYDEEVEEAVLGSMLSTREALRTALNLLEPFDFYVPANAALFSRMQAVTEAGDPLDALTLGVERTRITQLIYDTPLSSHVDGYAHRLRDLTVCRRSLGVAEAIVKAAHARDVGAVLAAFDDNPLQEVALPVVDMPVGASVLASEDHTPDWLVRNLLARWEIVMLVAQPGSGKTTLLNQIAVCCTSGIHPFNRAVDIPALTALVFDFQDSRGARGRSVKWMLDIAAGRYAGTLDANDERLFYELHTQGLDLTQARDQRWFEAKVALVQPDLIIAGPLYNMVRGAPGRSKQSEETAELAGSFLSELVVRRNCALLIEAHAPRGDDMRVRGSQYWEDWAGFGFGLVTDDKYDRGRAFDVERFRGDRETGRQWPGRYVQGVPGHWPWEAMDVPSVNNDGITEEMEF
jgi:hypothetical protein